MSTHGWIRLAGPDLHEASQEGYLDEVITDNCSAIYIWKKRLTTSLYELRTGSDAVEWVDRLTAAPNGIVQPKRLGQYLSIKGAELRSAAPPTDKRETLRQWLESNNNRKWFHTFLQHLSTHTPALYVGETGNLLQRTKSHLNGDTDFAQHISRHIAWDLLDLYYFRLGSPTTDGTPTTDGASVRQALEFLTTSLTIGGFTTRPG